MSSEDNKLNNDEPNVSLNIENADFEPVPCGTGCIQNTRLDSALQILNTPSYAT